MILGDQVHRAGVAGVADLIAAAVHRAERRARRNARGALDCRPFSNRLSTVFRPAF